MIRNFMQVVISVLMSKSVSQSGYWNSFPVYRKKLQNMYSYILVDEAQDIDEMQGKLIRLLVGRIQPPNSNFWRY